MILSTHGIIGSSGGAIPSSLNTNLYAVYNAENNANDSFGSNNGTPYGGLTYTTGKINQAFQFNGTNAYVSLPANSFNSLTNDFTYSCFYNTSTVSGSFCLLFNALFSGDFKGFRIMQIDQILEYRQYNGASPMTVLHTSNIFSINTWYHIVIAHSSLGNKIYINGNLITSDTNGIAVQYNNNTIPYFSRNGGYSPQGYISGKLDAINTWNRALTATEVTELYNSGTGKQYPF